MGILRFNGTPYEWNESIPHVPYVKEHGITQFLEIYQNFVHRDNDDMLWGDEIEYMLLEKNPIKQKVYLKLRGNDLVTTMNVLEEQTKITNGQEEEIEVAWKPEYANYMLEATPYRPYPNNLSSCVEIVEKNIKERDNLIQKYLKPNEVFLTMTVFPLFGALKNFTIPKSTQKQSKFTKSLFVSDEVMNPHPRFKTITQNARLRRGSRIECYIPLFLDKNTNPEAGVYNSFSKDTNNNVQIKRMKKKSKKSSNQYSTSTGPNFASNTSEVQKPSIFLDTLAFGMGCCCLQQTFQAKNLQQSRYLYDQFAVLAPIMLAITAASPIVKGLLADSDARWNILCGCCDDRTEEERRLIPKSRYGSVSLFISNSDEAKKFSDLPNLPINQEVFERLMKFSARSKKQDQNLKDSAEKMKDSEPKNEETIQIDEQLAKHIAHLWIRDPLAIYSNYEQVDDKTESDHFENIQSTNWQSVRWKPPPSPISTIGWRIEFRIMEIQFSAFENSSLLIFFYLLVKCILFFNLNLYMPISKVDENITKAHMKNSISTQKFWFRNSIFNFDDQNDENYSISQFSIDDIINGGNGFIGFLPIISKYLDINSKSQQNENTQNCDLIDSEERKKIEKYLSLISKRASGEIFTPARFVREFVENHFDYKNDSVVSEKICYDLSEIMEKIHYGDLKPEKLFPK